MKMSHSLKLILINLFASLNILFFGTGCALFSKGEALKATTEREAQFAKAKTLMATERFVEAEPLFLNLVAEPESNVDSIYDESLWSLSLVFEKQGQPEKSIFSLKQLQARKPIHISRFKILASLMKNYFRVGNEVEAFRYKKILDTDYPKFKLNADDIYINLLQTLSLNYDQLILHELEYVAEVQKYLLFVMEQSSAKSNEHATDLLISIYQKTYDLSLKNSLNHEFKSKIMATLIDNLNRFENYKVNEVSTKSKTVARFSIFSNKLKKQITDWFHQ